MGTAVGGWPTLVSVVVNNYNYGRFLRTAIDSVLAQTYRPLEAVVVDDGSTDNSREIIAAYGERVVPVYKSNGGMGSAMNAGFQACSGEIVIFLDSDDELLPSAAANARRLLAAGGVSKVHWSMTEIDEDGRPTGHVVPAWPLPQGDLRAAMIAGGPQAGQGAPTSGNAWSRRFLAQVLPMPEDQLRRHADSYLNTLAPLYGSIARLDHPGGRYRVHGANDYAGRPLDERFRRNRDMYRFRSALLAAHFRSEGVAVDAEAWSTHPHAELLERRVETLGQIAEVIPAGSTFVWADGGAWGRAKVLAGRQSVPFVGNAAVPGQGPADAAAAISQMERLRGEGATFAVFVKPVLWWLRAYRGFDAYMRQHYACVLSVPIAIVFDLRTQQPQ